MGVVAAAYEDLAEIRDSIDPNVVLFVHAYDFAFPDGRGACPGVGPWLKPSLDLRGWTNPADATFIVAEILRAFDPMLVQFELDHPNVVYVRTQGTLRTKSNWANELHPTPGGFGKIANVFLAALAARFPGRILERREKGLRRLAVLVAELRDVDADRLAVLDPPLALDHHPVGGVRAAEHERGERIAGAGEAQFVERVEARGRPACRPRSRRCRRGRGSAPSLRSPSGRRRDG